MKIGPTCSGRATIVPMNDTEALALQRGDVVLIQYYDRLMQGLSVEDVRLGVAGEDGAFEEVPVVEGVVIGWNRFSRPLVWAVPNLFTLSVAPEAPEEVAP